MTTLTKGKIGVQDSNGYDGVNQTFTRSTSTGGTQTLLSPSAGTGAVDILAVYGSGTNRTLATLNSAISSIGSNNAAILFSPGTWTITDDVTIPANIGIIPVVGAVLSVSAGKTLTINGDIWPYDAGFFAGAGTTTLTGATKTTSYTNTIGTVTTDTISEETAAAGVTIDGVKLKDSEVYTDVINEKTAATGVTVDGVLCKDGSITATGGISGYSNTQNSTNVGGGYQVLGAITTGTNNSVFGYQSGTAITEGVGNVGVGSQSLNDVTTGNYNVGIGYGALEKVSVSTGSVAIGYNAGADATSGICTAVGYEALSANTNGSSNTAVGYQALKTNITGDSSVAVGYQALTSNNTNSNNSAVGYQALYSATSIAASTAVGFRALYTSTAGSSSTAVGYQAAYTTTGGGITAIGNGALYAASSGANNTACGFQAGNTMTTGSNNGFLGYNAQPSAVDVSNEITLGDTNIATLRCQVALTVLSDERDKDNIEDIPIGLDFINELRPVKFDWNRRDGSKKGVKEAGFIAQEVDAVQGKYGVAEFMHLIYKSNPDKLEMTKENLLPVMVRAIQELSAKVEELEERLSSGGN